MGKEIQESFEQLDESLGCFLKVNSRKPNSFSSRLFRRNKSLVSTALDDCLSQLNVKVDDVKYGCLQIAVWINNFRSLNQLVQEIKFRRLHWHIHKEFEKHSQEISHSLASEFLLLRPDEIKILLLNKNCEQA